MNQYQNTIRTNVQEIFSVLSIFADRVTDYRKKTQEINAQEYTTQEGKTQQIQQEYQNVAQAAITAYSQISLDLKQIRQAAESVEESFNITPELQAVITVVNAAGEKLDLDHQALMWKQFIGDRHSLVTLKALYETKGLYIDEMKKYIIDAKQWCDDLDEMAEELKLQPGTTIAKAVALAKKLEKFCELEGVQLLRTFRDVVNADSYADYVNEQLREAFGV